MSTAKLEISKQINSRGETIQHLTINDVIWMSNDDPEYVDIDRALSTAHGRCYIGGLGLGLIVKECAKLSRVSIIDVVEINADIVNLVCPDVLGMEKNESGMWHTRINDTSIRVWTADATIFYPMNIEKYDWMYWDIWLEPDREGKRLMELCFRNAQNRIKPDCQLEAWLRPRLESGKLWS